MSPSHATPLEDVAVSDELLAPVGTGVELCYQTFGDPSGEPLLLVMHTTWMSVRANNAW